MLLRGDHQREEENDGCDFGPIFGNISGICSTSPIEVQSHDAKGVGDSENALGTLRNAHQHRT